jgi:hypothetical protein
MTLKQDTGCDPMGNGVYKMHPSGDLVDQDEKEKRLSRTRPLQGKNDCFGLSWDQIEEMQGGKLTR